MFAFNQNSLKKLDQSVLINLGGAAGLSSPLIKRVITLYQQDANQMVNGISHALSVTHFSRPLDWHIRLVIIFGNHWG